MAVPKVPVYEGDIVFLYCTEAYGYVYADPPCSKFSDVSVYLPEVSAQPEILERKDNPGFPNVHFAAFQILPSKAKSNPASQDILKGRNPYNRTLVYGRKIKLLHMASRKFLSFASSKDEADIHSTAILIDGKDGEEKECLLKVLPEHTGSSTQTGDVLLGDAIKLECFSTGHHILCIDSGMTSRFDVNRAVTYSIFKLCLHISEQVKIPRGAIRAGAVVLIQNWKHEVYLSAQGSTASGYLKDMAEELQSKGKKEDKRSESNGDKPGDEKHSSKSSEQPIHNEDEVVARKPRSIHSSLRTNLYGDNFWQFEDSSNPTSGDWVQFGRTVHIKHIPSQRYLAVIYKNDKPEYLSLKEQDSSMESSLDFVIAPMQTEKREKGLMKSSYVQIRHIHGEHVRALMINTQKNFNRQRSPAEYRDPADVRVEQFDRVYSLNLTLVDVDDTSLNNRQMIFKIEEVENSLVQEFYHILGLTTVIMNYTQKYITDRSSDFFNDSRLFGEWMREGQDNQVQAEMLRVTKAVDVMMILIQLLEIEHQTTEFLRSICESLAQFALIGGQRCCFYLAKKNYISLLIERVSCGINVEGVLSAMARDEIEIAGMILTHLIKYQVMKYETSGYRHTLDSPALDLFSTLCFCGGQPISKFQTIIVKRIIEGDEGSLIVRFRTKVDREAQALVISEPQELAGKTLNALTPEFRNVIISQVKLLSQTCKGCNSSSLGTIIGEERIVSFEEACLCINDSELDPLLRSAYLDFISTLLASMQFLGSALASDSDWNAFDWDVLTSKKQKAEPEPTGEYGDLRDELLRREDVTNLQQTIRTFLKSQTPLTANLEVDVTNEMIIPMLNVLEPLLLFEFYLTSDDTQSIIDILISLTCDIPDQSIYERPDVTKQAKDNNKLLYQIKTRALDILYQFFMKIFNTALSKMVHDFGALRNEIRPNDGDKDYRDSEHILKELLRHDYKITDELLIEARKRLRYYLAHDGYQLFWNLHHNSFIQSLIDVMQFKNVKLRVSSCKLLFAIFRAERILFSEANSSSLYTTASHEDRSQMTTLTMVLKLEHSTSQQSAINRKAYFESLRHIENSLIIDGKDYQPMIVNQNLAYSTGLVDVLLKHIHLYSKRKSTKDVLMTKICIVLQRIAKKNKMVKAKLFENYIDLVDTQMVPDAVAELLTEIFTDNKELCKKVLETDLSLIFDIASNSDIHVELFTTLQAMTKVSKSGCVLMPEFQDILARLISESLQDTFSFLVAKSNTEPTLFDILKDPNSENCTLVKMLNVCDLLGICCEGEKKLPEDICKEIFSMDELIRILEDSIIPIERKKPFACLLTEAYLISERQSLRATLQLAKSSGFWTHVEFVAELMQSASKAIQSASNIQATKIETLLHHLASRHLSLSTWRRLSTEISTTVTCGENEINISNILLYVIDGFLPMITAFCRQQSDRTRSTFNIRQSRTLLSPQSISVLKAVGDGIVALANQTKISFPSRFQVQLMCQYLDRLPNIVSSSDQSLLEKARMKLLEMEETEAMQGPSYYSWMQFKSKSVLEETELSSASSGSSGDTDLDVLELNQCFMKFVANYQQTYLSKLSEKQHESDPIGSGEELIPSDPSFTALIRYFYQDGNTEQRVAKLKHLLKFLDMLHQELKQPLTSLERNDLDSILLICLQLLNGVVYLTIKNSKYKRVVKPLQEALIALESNGAHECVIPHLSHPQDEVSIHAMIFITALVYKGNKAAQQAITHYLKSRDTKLFIKMNVLLQSTTAIIKGAPTKATIVSTFQTGSRYEENVPDSAEIKDVIPLTHLQPVHIESTKQTAENQEMTIERVEQQVGVILDLTAWMCDGQNTENQELFREQENQFNSVNIVNQVAILLQVLLESTSLSDGTIPIAHKATQALIELCTGNFANQQVVFEAQIVETLNNFLGKGSTNTDDEEVKFLRLKSHAMELLNILLEEISIQSYELIRGISQDLSIDNIVYTVKQGKNFEQESDRISEHAFKILKKISENDQADPETREEIDDLLYDDTLFHEINHKARGIDVVYRGKEPEPVLTRIYFPYNTDVQASLSETDKNVITWYINRDSPEDKVRDLVQWMKREYVDKEHKKYITSSEVLRWSYFLSQPRYYALIVLTLIMNLLTIIFFRLPTNQGDGSGDDQNSSVFVVTISVLNLSPGYYPALYVLGSLHLILSIWMLTEYIVTEAPTLLYQLDPFNLPEWVSNILDRPLRPFIRNRKTQGFYNFIVERNDYYPKNFPIHVFTSKLIYFILFVCFSILSLAFSGYWYSGCLLYVFLRSKLLGQVLIALQWSVLQILIVLLFGLWIIFIYAVISFAFFHGYFNSEDGLFCETLAQCFATVTREGLLGTLGTAIALKADDQDSPSFAIYGWRVLFDLSFFLIITTLGLNIIIAILVDNFSKLREKRENIFEQDNQKVCFICGIKNVTFEQKDVSFWEHINFDHDMWDYIYFYFYLQSMDPNDHSAIEKYVYDQIMQNEIKFFPLRKATVLVEEDKGQGKASTKDGDTTKDGSTSVPSGKSVAD